MKTDRNYDYFTKVHCVRDLKIIIITINIIIIIIIIIINIFTISRSPLLQVMGSCHIAIWDIFHIYIYCCWYCKEIQEKCMSHCHWDKRVSMRWWLLPLTVKILAILRLTVNFLPLLSEEKHFMVNSFYDYG